MPLDITTGSGWTRQTIGEVESEIQQAIDAALVAADLSPQDYDETLLGAIVEGVATWSVRNDSRVQAAYRAGFAAFAIGRQLDDIGGTARPRRPGVASRALFQAIATTGTQATIEAGRRVRINGEIWICDETATVDDLGGDVVYRADVDGPTTPGAAGTANVVDFVANLDTVLWSGSASDVTQVGRLAESDATYRTRLLAPFGGAADTKPGLRDRILSDLPWVQAVGVLVGTVDGLASGQWQITIAPGPATDNQTTALVNLLARAISAADVYSGSETGTGTYPDGTERPVAWEEGTQQTVDVDATLVLAPGVTLADVSTEVEEAIGGYFGALGTGDAARILAVLSAIATVDGVIGATVDLDGGTADVSPTTAADILVTGTVTVTE